LNQRKLANVENCGVGERMKKVRKSLGETTKIPNPPTHEGHLCVDYHHPKLFGKKRM
jgi:hypothetical protein